jgi:DNA-binding CsgD family transcriptional regulator
MKTPQGFNLSVLEKPHWSNAHTEADYIKHLKIISKDILLACIEAKHPVTLDFMDNDLFRTVLLEEGLADKPIHLIWDLSNVKDVSYTYKHCITDLLYRWGPKFSLIVFCNIAPSCHVIIETFAAVAPNDITVILTDSFENAIRQTLDFRAGIPVTPATENTENSQYALMKKEFLAAIARLSWFNMLDQQIFLPPPENSFHPFFKAVTHMQQDLKAREYEHQKELDKIRNNHEHQLTQKIIMLNAQMELNRKEAQQFEQEKSALKSRIAAQDMELTRISTAVAEKTSALRTLCDQIIGVEMDHAVKQKMLDQCQNMIETELTEKRLNTELTRADSEFLSKLQKKHPNLNQRELRVSLLVKLNYDTKEIARSIGISTRGMESIRYRMHKKLGLDKHKSIKTYLSDLAVTL